MSPLRATPVFGQVSLLASHASRCARSKVCWDERRMTGSAIVSKLTGQQKASSSSIPRYCSVPVAMAAACVRGDGWETEVHTLRRWGEVLLFDYAKWSMK